MPLNHTSQYAELTDDHYKAIGKIVVEWSNIEFLLGVLLSRLLITPEFLARSYTDRMSAAQMQEAIKEGVEIHQYRYRSKLICEENLEKITTINEQITALRVLRNKFAHFCWARNTDNEIFGTSLSGGVPTSKKHSKSYTTYTIAELANFHQEAYEIVDCLSLLIEHLPKIEEDGLTNKITKLQ